MIRRGTLTRTTILLSALIPIVVLGSCRDFFGTQDLKQIIGSEVAAANAPEIPVTLRADDDSMGLPNPYGDNNFKVGVEYSITTTVGQDYTFLAWTHNGEDGDVTFGDAGAVTTTVVVNREVEGLIIAPTFDQRPKIVTWTPFSGSSGNLTNQDITVTFSEPILDSCAILHDPESGEGTITITSVKTARITTDTPVHVESSFTAQVNGGALTIALKDGVYHDIFSTVSVTLSADFCDLAGNVMVEDFSWFFTTGSGADETGPTITAFSVSTASGGETAIGDTVAYTTDTELTLRVVAEDDQGDVTQMRVIETPWSSGSSSGGATGSAIEHGETDYLQQSSLTLSAADNTWTRVQVQVADTAFNWSSLSPETDRNTKYVYRDLGAPSVDAFVIDGGESYTSSTTPPVSVSVSDAGIGGIEYALTSSTATPGSWSDTAPTTVSLSGGDGEKTRYLHVRDAFGNAGYDDDSIILDRQAPSGAVGTISTTGNPGWVLNGQSVRIDFTVTDSASGVAGTPTAIIAGEPATVTGTAPDFEASLTFSGDEPQGPVSYTIDAVDNAGNSMTQLSGSTGITYDRDPPSVSIGAPSVSHAADGTTVTFAVTYADGAEASSITLGTGHVTINAGGDATATVSSVTGSMLVRTVTVTAGTGDGDVGISIAAATATDAAGNPAPAAGPSATFAVDNTQPEVSISAPVGGPINNSGSVDYNISYNESGTYQLNAGLVTVNTVDGTATASASVSGGNTATPTVTISSANGDGTLAIVIQSGAMTDQAGNDNAASAQSATVVVDNTDPTGSVGTITSNGNSGWVRDGQWIDIPFTADDSGGTGLNGTPTAFIAGESVTVTGTAPNFEASLTFSGDEPQGPVSYTIDAEDNAGNSMTPLSGSTGITYDRDPPSITIGAPSASYAANGDTVTFDVTYADGEGVSSITLGTGDVTINAGGGATATVTSVTGSTLDRTVTVTAGTGDGNVGISIAADTATDGAGNPAPGAGPSATFAVDNTGPSITGSSLTADATSITGLTTTDGGSGVDTGSYTLSGGGGAFDGSSMTGLTAPAQGSHTDYVIGVDDNVGNTGQVTVRHSRDMSDNYTATIQ